MSSYHRNGGRSARMRAFVSALAFTIVFIPFAGFGLLSAIGLREGGKGPGEPVLGVIIGVLCMCIGLVAGGYSARATAKRHPRPGGRGHAVCR
jgi:hypothetical protein